MAQLNQIIAVSSGKKSRVQQALTEIYHALQKSGLTDGIARTYRPKTEDGDMLPPEQKQVQLRAEEVLQLATEHLSELFDVVATQDAGNCVAKADIVVDGKAVLKDVPVTTLLWLEKQLLDVATLIGKMPTLDPAIEWEFSTAANCWASKPSETHRTKKVPRHYVKYEATKEHPAQVEMFTEDEIAGYWKTVHFSGAVPQEQKSRWVRRVQDLQDAVKQAREKANTLNVEQVKIGEQIFSYLFA